MSTRKWEFEQHAIAKYGRVNGIEGAAAQLFLVEDARLIACAPRMLDLLRRYLDTGNAIPSDPLKLMSEIDDKARALLTEIDG